MKLLLSLSLLAIVAQIHAQPGRFRYSRALDSVEGTWHHVELPPDMYRRLNESLSDIRILGITNSGDTIEAPYIRRERKEIVSSQQVSLTLRNQSRQGDYFFVTVAMTEPATINRLELDIVNSNFDWRSRLEGSSDEKEWFTVLNDYRILSLQNEFTNVRFTTLVFPESNYKYYRLRIPTAESRPINKITARLSKTKEGLYHEFSVAQKKQTETPGKETRFEVLLGSRVPVTRVRLGVREKFDYYRSVSITCLVDSFKTDLGWQRNYQTLVSGSLNSIEKPIYTFQRIVTNRLTITIQNRNDQPLHVDSVIIQGTVDELVFRTTEPAKYSMYYGAGPTAYPHYDLENFLDRIPEETNTAVAGPEIALESPATMEALFTNKAWLWVVMGIIIILLGWLTLKMLRKA